MIQSLKITDQFIAVAVTGTVDKGDWEKVTDAVNKALNSHQKVSICADLTHLDSMTGGAIYEDAKLSIQSLGNLDQFSRVAVVTDEKWIQQAVGLSEKLLPGVESQVYSSAQADEAHRWAAAA